MLQEWSYRFVSLSDDDTQLPLQDGDSDHGARL